jgi:hypothetical protein
MSNTYDMQCTCGNCHFKGDIAFQKGTPAGQTECPNCGCKTARPLKASDTIKTLPMPMPWDEYPKYPWKPPVLPWASWHVEPTLTG